MVRTGKKLKGFTSVLGRRDEEADSRNGRLGPEGGEGIGEDPSGEDVDHATLDPVRDQHLKKRRGSCQLQVHCYQGLLFTKLLTNFLRLLCW